MDKEAFGKRIRKIRKENGLSVIALAKQIGVSASHLREIENGNKLPSLQVFVKLVEVLDVMADELLSTNSRVADAIAVNSLTRRMRDLPKEKFDLLVYICDTLINRMKTED